MNQEGADLIRRWRSTAQTWLGKVSRRLRAEYDEETRDEVRWLIGWEAAQLLRALLDAADTLVETVDADNVDDLERQARNLAHRFRAHRLLAKMENTSGRTPDEIEAFRAKAEELRAPADRQDTTE